MLCNCSLLGERALVVIISCPGFHSQQGLYSFSLLHDVYLLYFKLFVADKNNIQVCANETDSKWNLKWPSTGFGEIAHVLCPVKKGSRALGQLT